jgi:hypothetical protein
LDADGEKGCTMKLTQHPANRRAKNTNEPTIFDQHFSLEDISTEFGSVEISVQNLEVAGTRGDYTGTLEFSTREIVELLSFIQLKQQKELLQLGQKLGSIGPSHGADHSLKEEKRE